jgi:hypothetical protein
MQDREMERINRVTGSKWVGVGMAIAVMGVFVLPLINIFVF